MGEMFILLIIALIACAYFFYEFRRFQNAYKTVVEEHQKILQKSKDNNYFYIYLFYNMATKSKYKRSDFQDLISIVIDNIPVRGGGSKGSGYWENILDVYNILPVYENHHGSEYIVERCFSQLADAMWLAYDQEIHKNHSEELNND